MSSQIQPSQETIDQNIIHPESSVSLCGRKYSCELDKPPVLSLACLVISAVLLIFALVLASGVFGGGGFAFGAGCLTLVSMVGFALGAYLLAKKPVQLKN